MSQYGSNFTELSPNQINCRLKVYIVRPCNDTKKTPTVRQTATSSSGQQWEGKTILTGRNSQYLLRLVQVEGRKMGPNAHCGSVERLFPTDLSQQGKHRASDCDCSAQEM